MKYRQVELAGGNSVLICWLEADPRIKEGAILTLKEIPDVKWEVRAIYSEQEGNQRRTWRVGGIPRRSLTGRLHDRS